MARSQCCGPRVAGLELSEASVVPERAMPDDDSKQSSPDSQVSGDPSQGAAGSREAWRWGLGCAGLLLLAGGAVVASVWAMERGATPAPIPAGGGPLCRALADCCRQVMARHQGDAQVLRRCDNFLHMPESGCAQQQDAYRRSATAVGLSCP